MTLDLTVIESAAASLVASAAKIQTGVANLKAENEALKAAVDPTAQSRVNVLAAGLAQTASTLQTLADGLPVIPPPGPPA